MFYKGNEDREKRLRFSIRKVSFGAASVAVAALFMFPGNGTVSATEQGVTPTNEGRQGSPLKDPDVQNGTYGATPVVSQLDGNSGSSETTAPKDQEETTTPTSTDASAPSVESPTVSKEKEETSTTATPAPVVSSTASATEKATSDLDKKQLEDYVAEIDAKLASGSYATKTDESVATLKEHLELAKLALTTATSQEELTKAYRRLFMTASSGLRSKPKAQVESPKLDTTEGKATVGKKASNTEKATESNSIANSGQHDSRNGQALDRNNPFRTDGATTDTDPAANQVYREPDEDTSVNQLAKALKKLNSSVNNETKLASIDEVGVLKNVRPGEVKEIDEFGGWTAITDSNGNGKFAVARKTAAGVFPLETVNTVKNGLYNYQTWTEETSFDKSSDYALFLSKVRTEKTKGEPTFDGAAYKPIGEGGDIAKGLKGFNGIEKTFKVYSPSIGSSAKISFKTGYTGDINGKKAKYRVELAGQKEDGSEDLLYSVEFEPQYNKKNKDMTVVAAKNGTSRRIDTPISNDSYSKIKAKLEEIANRPNGQAGTFTSKDIDIPKGYTSYKVRISSADNQRLGMGYQVTWDHYALPVTGLGFTVTQDTRKVAKDLLTKIYDKLKVTVAKDEKGMTAESKAAYNAELENVRNLVETPDLTTTDAYKAALTTVLQKKDELKVDKSSLTAARTEIENLITTVSTEGKVQNAIDEYNKVKAEAQTTIDEAKKIIDSDASTVDEVALAVAEVKQKKAELKVAEAGLVDKMTDAQKAELEKVDEALAPANLDGKTPKSVEAYNAAVAKLQSDIDATKAKAKEVVGKGDNATKAEATETQVKLAELKAKLAEAKALLKDKSNKDELTTAKEELDTLAKAEDPTVGKTEESKAKYDDAKRAAEASVTAAEKVINNEDATAEQVAAALADVKIKKAALETAKAGLVAAATDEEKASLRNAEADLTPASTAGKTPKSVEAYNAEVAKINDELEAAKQAAADVLGKDGNASEVEALKAQEKVNAAKAKLVALAGLLKDPANKDELTTAKKALEDLTGEADPTEKTTDSLAAYTAAKDAAKAELTKAETVLKDESATQEEVAAAVQAVNAKKAELEKAKALLSDKMTDAQKAELEKVDEALAPANLDGKTPKSVEAYNAAVAKLQSDIDATKAKAKEVVGKGDNATKAEATETQVKLAELKAKLAEAKALLKDKSNKAELTTAKEELDTLAKAEDPTVGKTEESKAKYDDAKTAAEASVTEAEKVINNEDATAEEVAAALADVKIKKAALETAKAGLVDKITQDQKDELANADEDLKLADTTGKTNDSIKVYNDEVGKLSADLEAAKQAAKDLLAKGDNAGELEAYRLQAKISKLKSKLATAAKLLKDIDKSAVKKEVEEAAKNATDAIEANADLTAEQKEAAKAKIADEANKAIATIDSATTEDDVTAAKDAGKLAIAKEAAKAELEAAQAIKEKVIAGNEKLSDDEKQAVKEQVQNVVDEAKKAIDTATEQVAVDNAKTTGKEAIDALNPVGKEKALDEIQKVTEAKLEAIDKNEKLSDKEKAAAKAAVAKAAIAVVEAINEATDQATVDAKVTEGTKAISSVAEVGKDQAKAAIDSALSAKETAIDANDKLSEAEKSTAKSAAKKAAEDAKKAIESATTQAEVDAKVTEGSQAISSVAEVGKDKAKSEIDSALSAKETAIDANDKLSDAEKSAAKAAAKKAAEDAKKAIESATIQAEVDEAKTTGITAISAVNPVGKEKALAEIETALAEKSKAIDARTDLLTAEKTTAKKAAESEAETAKDAIRKAMSQDDVAKVTEVGKANIAKIDPVGAKAAFKKAVEEVLADKLKEIDARTDLTFEDKNKKKELVNKVAAAAKQAIDSSTTQAELDKVLRTFLYQVDQDALVADFPELKLEDALKALINGVVKVERGKALSQADVLAKLDLPEEISVLNMVLPDTNTIGTKVATVTLRLADGSVQKLEVPVEVILPKNQNIIPPYNGGNYGPSADNGMTNTQAKVNKSKLESAIHQLDELIIQESAKLDAETAKEANALSADAKKVFANADASQAEVDAMVKRIEDFMAKLAPVADHVTPAEDQSVQTPAVAPATAQAANASQTASAQANAPKASKELPNTGTADSTVAMVAAAASALLGLGLAGRRRKEDEEA